MDFRDDALTRRVALVTGASGGIGSAIALRLAGAGAAVAVAYGRQADRPARLVEAITNRGGRAVALGADLRQPDAPGSLVDAATERLGPVDILIANAGVGRRLSLEEVDLDDWDEHQAVNLRAPFLLAQLVVPGMRARQWGRIVFISSVAAFTGGIVGPHYASSKAGLLGLTHSLAAALAPHGVTVNAIAPGLIEETGMLPGNPDDLKGRVPVGRLGRPEEVADLVLAVVSNGYLTNQTLSLDGGSYPR
ncbi:MAG TPA: SDR family NAD(P)-dependent oxidoreductase [Acidimicrobiia bacterium]|jgi:3-oxoacyl-[acyl-carrier protein] reductase|nr:SDR family NAD(P)-dependent oxidoreductase [Acidimicrobiia bacterium]